MTQEARQALPSHIGHYEIVSIIGRGGMGLVYLARDPRLDRQVAIKCLRTDLFEEHYRERFKREALLLAKLNHPHIVQIYDFIESPEQLALVMEYVDGHNLQVYLREHIASFHQRLVWLSQITQGLAIAHDAGIIHRDLKTENILINKRNIAKLSDLGIAKSQDFNATITDHVAGSYCSMSPEQAMGEAINFKSDLFSLGILAYQLLCGAHPFGDTSNKLQVMQRIISHPPIPPTRHNPDLTPEIVNLLGQLLTKNPDNRPDNTHWVAAQFEKFSHLVPSQAVVTDETQALTPGVSRVAPLGSTSVTNHQTPTHEHPTFDSYHLPATTANKTSTLKKVYSSIQSNLISISLLALTCLILGALAVWQLQPKPAKYIAVVPPVITSKGMSDSQRELIDSAVYDAIQQSVLQLSNFYLIPRSEVSSIEGNVDAIYHGTGADELITANLRCEGEACTITLSRLTPDQQSPTDRLLVQQSKTLDVLTDNYLSVAETVQGSIGQLYSQKLSNTLTQINESDYSAFLSTNIQYRTHGESLDLLDRLDALPGSIQSMSAAQTLYCEIALDLFHETKEKIYLNKALSYIGEEGSKPDNLSTLVNYFQIRAAEGNFSMATEILEKIAKLNGSSFLNNLLLGHLKLAQQDYKAAINFYKRATASKKTTDVLYKLAIAYLYSGDTQNARNYVLMSLALSPEYYNALSLYGAIALIEGKTEEAIQALEKIRLKTPDDITNLANLGFAYLLGKQYAEAQDLFQHAAMITPTNTTILLNLADTKSLLGNDKESEEIYQKIIEYQHQQQLSNELLRNSAQAHAHLHQFAEAMTLLETLNKLDPDNIETMYSAALVHAIAHNNTLATLSVKAALTNGINKIWFSFPWFDGLCSQEDFVNLMTKFESPERCAVK